MPFFFEEKSSDSPLVEVVWHTHTGREGWFTSVAESRWGMVITKEKGQIRLTVRGPETRAMPAPVPEDADIFGIVFTHGVYMPPLPTKNLVDAEINLPVAASRSFWLHGSAWEFPNFENVDTFIQCLVKQGLLMRDPVVATALQEKPQPLSARSIERRFRHVTGLTHGEIRQIQRARYALSLLEQGTSILDTVERAGYFDQPHLTRSLKRLMGQTPAQIARLRAAT